MTQKMAFLILAAIAMAGCGSAESGRAVSTAPADASGSAAPKLTAAGLATQPRIVIRKASIQIQVDHIDETEKKVQTYVRSVNGYVDSEEGFGLSSSQPQMTIKLRVPQETFESAMAEIEKLGVRQSKSVSAEDVTEQIVDMEARLKTMLAQEETYRQILKSQKGVKGVLEVQDHLMKLREVIESVAAQRKSLAGQAALSTIELTLVQNANISIVAASDPNWLSQGWIQAWSAGIGAFRFFIVSLMWLLVFSPVWVSAYFLIRHRRSHKATA